MCKFSLACFKSYISKKKKIIYLCYKFNYLIFKWKSISIKK